MFGSPTVIYGEELLPPPPPPVLHGVETLVNRKRRDWNDICDESEGAVTYFVDAPLVAKDVTLPQALRLTLLLVPEADISTGILLEPPSTNGETTPEVFSAPQPNKLQKQLHDLELTLAIERVEFEKAIAASND